MTDRTGLHPTAPIHRQPLTSRTSVVAVHPYLGANLALGYQATP